MPSGTRNACRNRGRHFFFEDDPFTPGASIMKSGNGSRPSTSKSSGNAGSRGTGGMDNSGSVDSKANEGSTSSGKGRATGAKPSVSGGDKKAAGGKSGK
jgi:hypothetical protein